MASDLFGNVFMTFSLVSHVYQTMIDEHFEFGWSSIPPSLILVELPKTRESCMRDIRSQLMVTEKELTKHELLVLQVKGESSAVSLKMESQNVITRTAIVAFNGEGACFM